MKFTRINSGEFSARDGNIEYRVVFRGGLWELSERDVTRVFPARSLGTFGSAKEAIADIKSRTTRIKEELNLALEESGFEEDEPGW